MKNNILIALITIVVALSVIIGMIALISNTWVGLGIFIICGIVGTISMILLGKININNSCN